MPAHKILDYTLGCVWAHTCVYVCSKNFKNSYYQNKCSSTQDQKQE